MTSTAPSVFRQALPQRRLALCCALLFMLLSACSGVWAASPQMELPWQKGQELVPGWRIVGLESQTEFVRFRLKGASGEHVVEVTYNSGLPGEWATRSYRVQPAPGENPPLPLLSAVLGKLQQLDAQPEQKPFVTRHVLYKPTPLAESATWPALPLLLVVGVFVLLVLLVWRRPAEFLRRRLSALGADRAGDWALRFLRLLSFGLRPEPPRRSGKDWLLALGVAGSCFAYFQWLGLRSPIWLDVHRELLLARDCLEGYGCHFSGSPSSFSGLVQGAFLIHFLAFCQWFDLSINAMQNLMLLLHALAAGLFFLTMFRFISSRTALLGTVLFVIASQRIVNYPVLWGPGLAPLPLVVFAYTLLEFVRCRRAAWVVVAGFSLALAMDCHFIVILLLPAYFFVLFGYAKGPGALLWGLAGFFGALGIVSYEAHLYNFGIFVAKGYWLPFFASLGLVFGLGRYFHPRLNQATPPPYSAIADGFALYSAGCFLLLQALLLKSEGDARYWLPAAVWLCAFWARAFYVASLPPAAEFELGRSKRLANAALAILLATPFFWLTQPGIRRALPYIAVLLLSYWLLTLPFRRWAGIYAHLTLWVLPVLLCGLLVRPEIREETVSLNDAQTLARQLYSTGCSYADIEKRLRGPFLHSAFSAFGVFEPSHPAGCAKASGEWQLNVFSKAQAAKTWPRDFRVVPLEEGRQGVIEPLESWLDFRRLRICFYAQERADGFSRCAEGSVEDVDQNPQPAPQSRRPAGEESNLSWGSMSLRAYRFIPGFQAARDEALRTSARRWRVEYSMPVAPRGEDDARFILIVKRSSAEWKSELSGKWRLAQLEGVAQEGPLLADQVRLKRGVQAEGRLYFSAIIKAEELQNDPLYPPEFLEVRPRYEPLYLPLWRDAQKRPAAE